jgi:hypothetical protein
VLVWKNRPSASDARPTWEYWRSIGKTGLRTAGRSLLALSVGLLTVYLALAPQLVAAVEIDYQANIAFLRHPSEQLLHEQALLREVRADREVMRRLERRVEAQLADENDAAVQ